MHPFYKTTYQKHSNMNSFQNNLHPERLKLKEKPLEENIDKETGNIKTQMEKDKTNRTATLI